MAGEIVDPNILLVYFGAILGMTGGFIGSALGISKAASSGLAVLGEDAAYFKNVMLLAALPMTQTFYGFVFALYTLTIALPGMMASMTPLKAAAIFSVEVMVFAAELYSANKQGEVCMSGIMELPKTKGKITTSTMILAAYEEIFGILGMVFGIVMLSLIAPLSV